MARAKKKPAPKVDPMSLGPGECRVMACLGTTYPAKDETGNYPMREVKSGEEFVMRWEDVGDLIVDGFLGLEEDGDPEDAEGE